MQVIDEKRQLGVFTSEITYIVKGILIILLIWHHVYQFAPHVFEDWRNITGGLIKITRVIGGYGGGVVGVFAFLSGYGLNETYKIRSEKIGDLSIVQHYKFIFKRIFKLWVGAFMVFVIFVPIIYLIDNTVIERHYGSQIIKGIINDNTFHLFKLGPGWLNQSWWFLHAIVVFYLLFPIVKYIGNKGGMLSCTIFFALITLPILENACNSSYFWYFQFIIGVLFSEIDFFKYLSKHYYKIDIIISFVMLLAIGIYLNQKLGISYYWLFPHWGIVISTLVWALYYSSSKLHVWNLISNLGKISSDMYLIHVFVYAYLFKKIVYMYMHPFWMIGSAVILTVLVTIVFRFLKRNILFLIKQVIIAANKI